MQKINLLQAQDKLIDGKYISIEDFERLNFTNLEDAIILHKDTTLSYAEIIGKSQNLN